MKNLILGIIVLATIGFGIFTIFDFNKNQSVDSDFVRDDFGEKYDIDNEYFVESTSTEVFNLIKENESLIVFVGRET